MRSVAVCIGGNAEHGFELVIRFRAKIGVLQQLRTERGHHLRHHLLQQDRLPADLHFCFWTGSAKQALGRAQDCPAFQILYGNGLPSINKAASTARSITRSISFRMEATCKPYESIRLRQNTM